MIVTVTLNPSLDRTLCVPALHPGAIHRAQFVRQDLGGKGINVSRALRALGIPSRITGFAGGWTGKVLRDGLSADGYDICFVEVGGETRQNITLLDEAANEYTKINEPGPRIGAQHVDALQARIEEMTHPNDLWVFSGSLPPGAPLDLYAQLITRVQAKGAVAFVDASGAAFRAGLAAAPFAVKINTDEAAEFCGRPMENDPDVFGAVQTLQSAGVRLVALTRGARGLVLGMDGQLVSATPPPVAAHSSVGAGDATLAGLLWAVSEQCNPGETARRAVACGTAAAMQEGTAMGDRALIERLLDQIQITSR